MSCSETTDELETNTGDLMREKMMTNNERAGRGRERRTDGDESGWVGRLDARV